MRALVDSLPTEDRGEFASNEAVDATLNGGELDRLMKQAGYSDSRTTAGYVEDAKRMENNLVRISSSRRFSCKTAFSGAKRCFYALLEAVRADNLCLFGG